MPSATSETPGVVFKYITYRIYQLSSSISFSSYVDSQNSFGAMIRTHFSGIIKETNSGWLIEELNYQ